MANQSKNLIVGSMIVAGLVTVAAIVDLAAGGLIYSAPAEGNTARMIMDITFILGGAAVLYMGWDAYKDLR